MMKDKIINFEEKELRKAADIIIEKVRDSFKSTIDERILDEIWDCLKVTKISKVSAYMDRE